jgi:cytochrome c peroxidase
MHAIEKACGTFVWTVAGVVLAASAVQAPAADLDKPALRERARGTFGAIARFDPGSGTEAEQARRDLGRMLYYDGRLSVNDQISCNSCHDLARFGVDGEPTSPGHAGERGGRNSPTSLNAFGHIAQFWDGRAKDVEEQAKGPVLNPVEMGMADEATVVAKIKAIDGYGPLFAKAFPDADDPITYDNIAGAIGAFERGLSTPGRFDAWLNGDDKTLTDAELQGLQTFLDTGCIACHQGPLLGGMMYQKLGLVRPYETTDIGRAEVTGNDVEKFFFKVPSLRNVAETGPYFHDGSVKTLPEAVKLMAAHQLGRDLDEATIAGITTFLAALTGEVDASYTAKPELP